MKKSLVCLISILLIFMCAVSGCGKEFSYGKIERDTSLTGGNLSFVYDEMTHTATFGGEGEVVAYYPADAALGREKGNRIGFKIYAPCECSDFSKAKLSFQGSEYTGGTFMQTVYENNMNYFVLTPLVDENNRDLTVSVTWEQNSQTQTYHIKVADGTLFAPEVSS